MLKLRPFNLMRIMPAVGSHDKKILQEASDVSLFFLLYRKLLVFIIGLKCQWILALGSITNRGGEAW